MESNLGEWNLGESKPGQWSTDRVEQELVRFESVVGSARAAQMALLSELDRHQLSLRTRLERRAEQWICSERLAIQVNLDQTGYRLWGELPGEAGGIVSSALSTRGESFHPL